MPYYRVTSGGQDVFAALEEYGSADEAIRSRKPDDSWLPKVKKKFMREMWYWNEEGMHKLAESGLKDWYELMLSEPLEVRMIDELPGRILYQNKYQIFIQE